MLRACLPPSWVLVQIASVSAVPSWLVLWFEIGAVPCPDWQLSISLRMPLFFPLCGVTVSNEAQFIPPRGVILSNEAPSLPLRGVTFSNETPFIPLRGVIFSNEAPFIPLRGATFLNEAPRSFLYAE